MPKLAYRLGLCVFAFAVFAAPLRWRVTLAERLDPPIYADFTSILLPISLVAMLVACLLVALSSPQTQRSITTQVTFAAEHWLLLALAVCMALSSLTALDPLLSFWQMAQWLALAGASLWLLRHHTPLFENGLRVGLMGFVLSQSLISIGQVWQQRSLGLAALGEWALDPQVRGVSVVMLGDLRFLRAYGLADHPNMLGGALALALLFLLFSPLAAHSRISRAVITFSHSLGALALYLTFSRAAWLAWGIGLAVGVGWLAWRRQFAELRHITIALICAGIVVLLAISVTLSVFANRLDTTSTMSNAAAQLERDYLGRAALPLLAQAWLTGLGMGAVPAALKAAYPVFPLDYQSPHFVPLVVALELGLLGSGVYILLMLKCAVRLLAAQRLAPLVALLGLLVIGLFDYYPWHSTWGRLWHSFILAWGLLLCSKSYSSS